MIEIQKGENNEDKIGNIIQGGVDLSKASQVSQYKTLTLRVGFDEEKQIHQSYDEYYRGERSRTWKYR